MTKEKLIAFLRAKLNDRFWEMHGQSIERQIDKYTESVRTETIRELFQESRNEKHGG